MERRELSFSELVEGAIAAVIRDLAAQPRGLVLVTGPTGAGKTTTLAAMIDHINNTKPVHILTIEDPIEVLHPHRVACINQREIGVDTDSYVTAMRAAMRQDPDVILIGEMRDTETVFAALTAAETGHLVLSTLHTTDAVETVNRIVDFFPPFQQHQVRVTLSSVLRGVICQRLVARIGGGRVPVCEIMVNNGRVADRIIGQRRGPGGGAQDARDRAAGGRAAAGRSPVPHLAGHDAQPGGERRRGRADCHLRADLGGITFLDLLGNAGVARIVGYRPGPERTAGTPDLGHRHRGRAGRPKDGPWR